MEYTVIEHYRLNEFITRVNDAISKGWMPVGGVSKAVSPGNSETWSQAMTRNAA